MKPLILALPVLLVSVSHAAEVVIHPAITYQRIFGYGQGSMDQQNPRWFERLDENQRRQILDWLYTYEDDGLGLNICRTYICAGDAPGHNHMARRPGGSRHPLGYEIKNGVFKWDGHENTLWHAKGAHDREAFMVAFFNSPPWWLTISGCTAGAAGGGNNLRPGKEQRFAKYICDVLNHYRDPWGIEYDRVSPINEPEAGWWKARGGQDGCHVDAEQAAKLIAALANQLDEYGLPARIQAPEAAFSSSLDYLDTILANEGAYRALAELTCHQYITDPNSLRKWAWRSRIHEKPLWMSEWGDWTNHGIKLALNYAQKLHAGHRVMKAVAWCMWEPAFLIDTTESGIARNTAFFATAQFTRFARPGMTVIEASDVTLKTTCYLHTEDRRIVIITVNDTGDDAQLSYNVTAFEGITEVNRWRTSETERLSRLDPLQCNGTFHADIPARTVTTFAADYKTIKQPLVANGGFETGELDHWQRSSDQLVGIETNYPHGGLHDAFIHPTPEQAATLSQGVDGLRPGRGYALNAVCATSGVEATLAVIADDPLAAVQLSGGAYQMARLNFAAPDGGKVTIRYSAGPAAGKHPWAVIDNVRISPLD